MCVSKTPLPRSKEGSHPRHLTTGIISPLLFRMNSGFDIPSSLKRVWLPLATFWIFLHQSSTHFIPFIEERVWNAFKVSWPRVPLEYTVREMGRKLFGGLRWKPILLLSNSKWTERLCTIRIQRNQIILGANKSFRLRKTTNGNLTLLSVKGEK